ncbi:MAG: TonB-dependent receptor [Planctomycetota bacterium]|nr:TonB-dependent receptor [Planctomycetota bacterium]
MSQKEVAAHTRCLAWQAVALLVLATAVIADDGENGTDDSGGPSTAARITLTDDAESAETPAAAEAEEPPAFTLTNWLLDQPPQLPVTPPTVAAGLALPSGAQQLAREVFGSEDVRRSRIAEMRRGASPGPMTELVFGSEARFRVANDTGNLLGKSLFTPSVKIQERTPVISDPVIRGGRTGRLLASGSYWAPARQDLDTPLSRIDARFLSDAVVIKGPYTAMLGPGFYFVDFRFLDTPRYEDGPQWNGSTSLEYKTNGQQWYGLQSVWGGGENYGYRIGYGHRTGNDYLTGAGSALPTSYNTGDLNVAIGYDFSSDSRLEFNCLREDTGTIEFPGMVFDINGLTANGYELRYTLKDQPEFDLLSIEGWYNETRFTGDTSRSGKNRQIPSLRPDFDLGPAQYLTTDVDGMSAGYRAAVTWGQTDTPSLTVGTDLIRVGQQLNDNVPARVVPAHTVEIEPGNPIVIPALNMPAQNYPIPRSHTLDFGVFAEHTQPFENGLRVRTGARLDMISANSREMVPGMGKLDDGFPSPQVINTPLSVLKGAPLEQQFYPWSVFLSADYQVNCCWTVTGGVGYGMRPPTLTELYAYGPFIGSLQPGLTYVEGDPLLRPERMLQADLGVRANFEKTRFSLTGFQSWVNDYITYDYIEVKNQFPFAPYVPGQSLQQVAYVNTDYATLTGCEFTADHDFRDWLTGFAVMSYVQGFDHTRLQPSRIGALERVAAGSPADTPRSFNGDVAAEPLPGIPPLEARLGLRVKQPGSQPRWAAEVEARLVDQQNLVASTLYEQTTPGFTVWNLRAFCRPYERFTLYGGVENIGNVYYREHLDYRSGLSVWRTGVNYYLLSEVVY